MEKGYRLSQESDGGSKVGLRLGENQGPELEEEGQVEGKIANVRGRSEALQTVGNNVET